MGRTAFDGIDQKSGDVEEVGWDKGFVFRATALHKGGYCHSCKIFSSSQTSEPTTWNYLIFRGFDIIWAKW